MSGVIFTVEMACSWPVPTAYAMARGLPALLPERVDGGTGEPRRERTHASHRSVLIPVRGSRAMRAALQSRRTA